MRSLGLMVMLAACSSGTSHGHVLPIVDANLPLDGNEDIDGAPPVGNVTTSATWALESLNGTGNPVTVDGCPAGFDTAAIISQESDANGVTTGECDAVSTPGSACVVDLWDCVALAGTTTIPIGTWRQWVSITDHTGAVLYADSIARVSSSTVDDTMDVVIVDNGGYIAATWTLEKTGATIACGDVANEDGVELDWPGGLALYDCEDGVGGLAYSDPLPMQSYTTMVRLLDSSNAVLGQSTSQSVAVGDQNAIAPATYVIAVAP